MIELLPEFPDNVIAVSCRGKVTRRDYEEVLVPHVERMLEKHERLRLYYEVGPEFEGIEPGAVWEDFKVGVEHLSRWERIAVVTDVDWIGHSIRAFGFLIPGEIRIFAMKEVRQARDWIMSAAPST